MLNFFGKKENDIKLSRSVESLDTSLNEDDDKSIPTNNNSFVEEPTSVGETFGTIMKSFIKLMGWSSDFFEETESKASMYMTFFQNNFDEKIEDTTSNAIIYLNKLNEYPDAKDLTTVKYCMDKFLADMKGKASFSEEFITSCYDLNKFIRKLLKIFIDCSTEGTLFNHIDEILSTDSEMSKKRYDDLYEFYETKTDDDGENISVKSRLETVKLLAKLLKVKIDPNDIDEEVSSKSEGMEFASYEELPDIIDSFEYIKNGSIAKLISDTNETIKEVLNFAASFTEINECINKLRTVDPTGVKDYQLKLFNSFVNVITEYCLTLSAYIAFETELFNHITSHFSVIKTTFKRENSLLGL